MLKKANLNGEHVAALDILEEFEAIVSVLVGHIPHQDIVQRDDALWLAIGRIVEVVQCL